jgi:hypothetical protein
MVFPICRVQQDATNFDFRKRHYEMKRAKEELEYQMKTVSLNIQYWDSFYHPF